jgi:hypothetical protein
VGPEQGRPLVLIGERGQRKSHLMAVLFHALTDVQVTQAWLQTWGERLGDAKVSTLPLRSEMKVISESLQRQRYKFLWDILFDNPPMDSSFVANGTASERRKQKSRQIPLLSSYCKSSPWRSCSL